ncbi:MAG TPA: metalloregulator ArsR/SmtB family transcription factor [Streptosporangiaceae bacterium]|nr:metalloregulator ArsR/SmtB family transcription factor [Streptosporangiaceae bacterium]
MTTVGSCCSAPVREPIGEAQASHLASVLKALADPVRLRLVGLIAASDGGEACVCDLAEAFNLSQPTISHHLKVLRLAGLINSERRASWMYYSMVPGAIKALTSALDNAGAVT